MIIAKTIDEKVYHGPINDVYNSKIRIKSLIVAVKFIDKMGH